MVVGTPSLSPHTIMRIFGAVGLGLTIVVLKVLMPRVFDGIEESLIRFFELVSMVLDQSQATIERGGFSP